jgi:hypothetical protein
MKKHLARIFFTYGLQAFRKAQRQVRIWRRRYGLWSAHKEREKEDEANGFANGFWGRVRTIIL